MDEQLLLAERVRRTFPSALLLAGGCLPAFDVPPPDVLEITQDVDVSALDSTELFLVHLLSVSTDEPTQLTVELAGADTVRLITFPTWSTSHEEPLLGLVEQADYTATAILTNHAGFEVTGTPKTFNAGQADAPAPRRRVIVRHPDRMEPGYTIYPAKGRDGLHALVEAVDDQGRLVWQYHPIDPPSKTDNSSVTALQFHVTDGTLSGIVHNDTIRRFDLAYRGETRIWSLEKDAADGESPVAVTQPFHDEAVFVEDGSFWTFTHREFTVADYPVDSSNPRVYGEADIRTDVVLHVAEDGTIIDTWDLWGSLDQHRVGFEGDEAFPNLYDWSSANAIVPLAGDDFMVSLGNQSAVVKFSGQEVDWILGTHDGWDADYLHLLLDPVEADPLWFSHQHAPAVDELGRLWLFDNGSWDRGTPYDPALDAAATVDFSRVVAYEIDEAQRTVVTAFDFTEPGPPPLFANSRGNADPLPVTNNVLATYGSLVDEEAEARAADPTMGTSAMRILEIDSAGAVVFDLELTGTAEETRSGWQGDRAIRVPSLYPADVLVVTVSE